MNNLEQFAESVSAEAKRRLLRFSAAILIAFVAIAAYQHFVNNSLSNGVGIFVSLFILLTGFFVEYSVFRQILIKKAKESSK